MKKEADRIRNDLYALKDGDNCESIAMDAYHLIGDLINEINELEENIDRLTDHYAKILEDNGIE